MLRKRKNFIKHIAPYIFIIIFAACLVNLFIYFSPPTSRLSGLIMIKIQTDKAFEYNKNAVLTHYSCPCPCNGERPIGNVVRFLGWYISASVFNHHFSVYKSCGDKLRNFATLKAARAYIISQYDNKIQFV